MSSPGHLRIVENRLAPGQEWTVDAPVWRFVRISTGAAYWMDAAKPRALAEGEVLVASPAVKTLIRASQLNCVLLHGFTFAPELLYGFFTVGERRKLDEGPALAEPVRFLPSAHPLARQFADVIEHLDPTQHLVIRAELLRLVAAYLNQWVNGEQPSPVRLGSAQDRFEEIVCHMPDIELIQYSPEQLARLCGCGTRHFGRLFRKRFGESPRARQSELRLVKACQLLAASETKIAQVALDCGYRNLSLFHSMFKRRFGVNPSQWRAQAVKGDGQQF